jgi:hypothetical protein
MRLPDTHTAMPIATPSPLVGEGSTAGKPKLGWVRGLVAEIALLKRPLTRLRGVYHRAALRADPLAEPPSPTWGEGKNAAPHPDCFAIRPLPARGERLPSRAAP